MGRFYSKNIHKRRLLIYHLIYYYVLVDPLHNLRPPVSKIGLTVGMSETQNLNMYKIVEF